MPKTRDDLARHSGWHPCALRGLWAGGRSERYLWTRLDVSLGSGAATVDTPAGMLRVAGNVAPEEWLSDTVLSLRELKYLSIFCPTQPTLTVDQVPF